MSLLVESLPLPSRGPIARAFSKGDLRLQLTGLHSPSTLGLLLAQDDPDIQSQPHLVLLPEDKDVKVFTESLKFWNPNAHIYALKNIDEGLYSSLQPSSRAVAARLGWLHQATKAKPGDIFVASATTIMRRTIPMETYLDLCFELRPGVQVPSDLKQRLSQMGYLAMPSVEDIGTYAIRGGIIDIYSPAHPLPIRLELIGDEIESMRSFDPNSLLSKEDLFSAYIIPARETLFLDNTQMELSERFRAMCEDREVDQQDYHEVLRSISQGQNFYGMEFLLKQFYEAPSSPLEFFNQTPKVWNYHHAEILSRGDELIAELKNSYKSSEKQLIRPLPKDVYCPFEELPFDKKSPQIFLERIRLEEAHNDTGEEIFLKSYPLDEFQKFCYSRANQPEELTTYIKDKFNGWKNHHIIVSCHTESSAQRLQLLLEKAEVNSQIISDGELLWQTWSEQDKVTLIVRQLPDSGRLSEDRLILLRDEDFWAKRKLSRSTKQNDESKDKIKSLNFGDLKPGDFVVHQTHGIGIYQDLEIIDIGGVPAEFIQIKYRGTDKLYLPVYRIGQLTKYSGPTTAALIDKLGGSSWAKTTTKVKKHLRDIADKLLRLYAKRASLTKDPYSQPGSDYETFENQFPYEETEDQLKAINAVLEDLQSTKPMDRLVCGDVGFGKTEVALRASFKVVEDRKQVAIVAPTTVLTFQHYETFKKRFKDWPINVRVLNRFISRQETKKILQELKEDKIDILIGTHRLLSKDVQFGRLGLLIIDEEQKFGVTHKEKIRSLKEGVDTLTLSATPIPRTLNMSLVGLRDLSLINTPPEERLPTRTFVCKYDAETIRKAIETEIKRGGQVFFLHNRVQSIEEEAAKLREIVPNARITIAHGQMPEETLEKTMMKFFAHEVDILVCTAIIESGLDVPRANTMFINNSQQFGVSQLYQLRGRVGRSKERAYCYLVIPAHKKIDKDAQERIRIIQENTALGSGIKVAHYDLELRGAGNMLGAEQSGHAEAVGYETYLELLDEAVNELKGNEPKAEIIDPEINLRIPAYLPNRYIPDIRIRLSYYKELSSIESPYDIDRIEEELRDQFGKPPDEVNNFLGLMLIRKLCRDLGVRDVSAGSAWLTLAFTEQTALPPQEVIKLTARENKKYQITPDQRLKVRMKEITWPRVHDELEFLLNLCPKKPTA